METKLTEYAIFLLSTRSVNRLYVYKCIVPKLTSCSCLSSIRFPTHLNIDIIYRYNNITIYIYCYYVRYNLCVKKKKKTEYYLNYSNFASILMCRYEEEDITL